MNNNFDLEQQILSTFENFCIDIEDINCSNDDSDFKDLWLKDVIRNKKEDFHELFKNYPSFNWKREKDALPKLNTLVILREYDNGNLYATHIAKLIKDNEENPYVWIIPYIVENEDGCIPIYINKSHQLFWSYIPDIPTKLIKKN